jgi:hypothetical protein
MRTRSDWTAIHYGTALTNPATCRRHSALKASGNLDHALPLLPPPTFGSRRASCLHVPDDRVDLRRLKRALDPSVKQLLLDRRDVLGAVFVAPARPPAVFLSRQFDQHYLPIDLRHCASISIALFANKHPEKG